jgi:hypothetical protein
VGLGEARHHPPKIRSSRLCNDAEPGMTGWCPEGVFPQPIPDFNARESCHVTTDRPGRRLH